ncbi:hypothetical protein HS7_18050 [Sulfolobales archaeon HS-7]|nr:hypothetical protein HS7_18050 [Sulfolobales archaeon HS-7]
MMNNMSCKLSGIESLKKLGLSEEEIDFAIERAKGIILGYAMEFRAKNLLEEWGYKEVIYVDLPTHDLEAVKDGERYYIEVKATNHSPTKEYSGFKLAMLVPLSKRHLTLVMRPEPKLYFTVEVLSKPKRELLEFMYNVITNNVDNLNILLREKEVLDNLKKYSSALKFFFNSTQDNEAKLIALDYLFYS